MHVFQFILESVQFFSPQFCSFFQMSNEIQFFPPSFLMQVQFDFVYDREKGRSKTNKGGCNAYIWSSQPTLGNRLLLLHCIAMLRPGAEFKLNCLGLDSIGKGSFGHCPNYLFPLPPIGQKCSWWKRPKKFGQSLTFYRRCPKENKRNLTSITLFKLSAQGGGGPVLHHAAAPMAPSSTFLAASF